MRAASLERHGSPQQTLSPRLSRLSVALHTPEEPLRWLASFHGWLDDCGAGPRSLLLQLSTAQVLQVLMQTSEFNARPEQWEAQVEMA